MASPTYTYERGAKAAYGDGATTPELDLVNDTIKAVLVSSAYVPNYDTHAFLSDVPAGLRVGAAVALAGKAWTKVGAGDAAKRKFTSNMVAFPAATARGMVIFKDTGVEGTSLLLHYTLLNDAAGGTDVTSAVGIEVTPDATNGWFALGKATALS
jgi:hypothetical protein